MRIRFAIAADLEARLVWKPTRESVTGCRAESREDVVVGVSSPLSHDAGGSPRGAAEAVEYGDYGIVA